MKAKDVLEESIVSHQAAIDVAKKKLAELETPVLRHGDYGIGGKNMQGEHFLRLVVAGDVWNDCNIKNPTARDPKEDVWLGNIFDDLKRNSEDLTEFEVDEFHVKWASPRRLIELNSGMSRNRLFTLSEAVEIHQKLGQMIATDLRKNK